MRDFWESISLLRYPSTCQNNHENIAQKPPKQTKFIFQTYNEAGAMSGRYVGQSKVVPICTFYTQLCSFHYALLELA